MRIARITTDGGGYYHCISRVVDRRRIMGPEEQEVFRTIMRSTAGFCGIEILTYAILGNHFHILAHVPPKTVISDEELCERMGCLYSSAHVDGFKRQLAEALSDGHDTYAEGLRQQYLYRMHDISQFMKTLKQRFSVWYNRKNDRKGTLWEERFKSLLVQGSQGALLTVAAYIDLNPVRAGIVDDPKDYRFSGYGEACGGGKLARNGLRAIMLEQNVDDDWTRISAVYRTMVYTQGVQVQAEPGRVQRRGISLEKVQDVLDKGGRLPVHEILRCRVRYFSDGVVLGSKAFVNEIYEKNRHHFGARRTDGARAMKWGEWSDLCTIRDLRQTVVSALGHGPG